MNVENEKNLSNNHPTEPENCIPKEIDYKAELTQFIASFSGVQSGDESMSYSQLLSIIDGHPMDEAQKGEAKKKANELIHETVKVAMLNYEDNCIPWENSCNQNDKFVLSPTLRIWSDDRIGVPDFHDSNDKHDTSTIGLVYIDVINRILNGSGVKFNNAKELRDFVTNLGFENGKRSWSQGGVDVDIYTRFYDPIHHRPMFPNNKK